MLSSHTFLADNDTPVPRTRRPLKSQSLSKNISLLAISQATRVNLTHDPRSARIRMCMHASTSRVAAPPLPIPKRHAATESRVQRHVSHRTDAPFPTHLSRPPDRAVRPTPNHTNINNNQDSYMDMDLSYGREV